MSLEKLNQLDYSFSLNEKSWLYLGELLAQRETDKLLQQIDSESRAGGDPAMNAFFARLERLQQEQIRRHFQKERLRSFFTRTVPKALRYAAAVFSAIVLAGGVALAASPTLRFNLATLLFSSAPTHTQFYLQIDPAESFEVPSDWHGSRYMSQLPDYAVLDQVFCFDDLCMAEYTHRDTGEVILSFSELGSCTVTNLDTENAFVSTVDFSGISATVVEKGQNISVVWSLGSKYYLLQCSGLPKEEVISIATGVKDIF